MKMFFNVWFKCVFFFFVFSVPHSSDEDEFFEAVEHQIEEFSVALPYDKTHRLMFAHLF